MCQGEDGDGMWVGILVSRDNTSGIIDKYDNLKKISSLLKTEYSESLSNNNYLGWITPLGKRMKYDYLTPIEKYELYTNSIALEDKLNDIYKISQSFLYKAESLINSSFSIQ